MFFLQWPVAKRPSLRIRSLEKPEIISGFHPKPNKAKPAPITNHHIIAEFKIVAISFPAVDFTYETRAPSQEKWG